MSEVLAWMTSDHLNALSLFLVAFSVFAGAMRAVFVGWGASTSQQKIDGVWSVLRAAHDAVEKLGPLAGGTKADRYVEVAHKALDFIGAGKPDVATTKALGAVIHEMAKVEKADALAAGMAADPQQPGA